MDEENMTGRPLTLDDLIKKERLDVLDERFAASLDRIQREGFRILDTQREERETGMEPPQRETQADYVTYVAGELRQTLGADYVTVSFDTAHTSGDEKLLQDKIAGVMNAGDEQPGAIVDVDGRSLASVKFNTGKPNNWYSITHVPNAAGEPRLAAMEALYVREALKNAGLIGARIESVEESPQRTVRNTVTRLMNNDAYNTAPNKIMKVLVETFPELMEDDLVLTDIGDIIEKAQKEKELQENDLAEKERLEDEKSDLLKMIGYMKGRVGLDQILKQRTTLTYGGISGTVLVGSVHEKATKTMAEMKPEVYRSFKLTKQEFIAINDWLYLGLHGLTKGAPMRSVQNLETISKEAVIGPVKAAFLYKEDGTLQPKLYAAVTEKIKNDHAIKLHQETLSDMNNEEATGNINVKGEQRKNEPFHRYSNIAEQANAWGLLQTIIEEKNGSYTLLKENPAKLEEAIRTIEGYRTTADLYHGEGTTEKRIKMVRDAFR